MKRRKWFTLFELLVVIAIVACLAGMIPLIFKGTHTINKATREYVVTMEKESQVAFDGWVKLTGNPKHLIYEEFKVLSKQGMLK